MILLSEHGCFAFQVVTAHEWDKQVDFHDKTVEHTLAGNKLLEQLNEEENKRQEEELKALLTVPDNAQEIIEEEIIDVKQVVTALYYYHSLILAITRENHRNLILIVLEK